jgi:nucleoside-diphosphate-sugar epimerase
MTASEASAPIGIVGAGRMGRGIATAFALAGHKVLLLDLRERSSQDFARISAEARQDIERDIAFLTEAGLIDAATADSVLADVTVAPAEQVPALLAQCDLVFEAVPETLEAKQSAFAIIGAHVGEDVLVASTTSTIDAETLAAMLPHPRRFMNAHWLNPAHLVPLVEVSPAKASDPASRGAVRHAAWHRQGAGGLPLLSRLYRPAYSGAGDERGGTSGRRRRGQRAGCGHGDPRGLRLPFRGAGPAGIHRLGRRRHSLPCQQLPLGDT